LEQSGGTKEFETFNSLKKGVQLETNRQTKEHISNEDEILLESEEIKHTLFIDALDHITDLYFFDITSASVPRLLTLS
jgi:hypothetical protein